MLGRQVLLGCVSRTRSGPAHTHSALQVLDTHTLGGAPCVRPIAAGIEGEARLEHEGAVRRAAWAARTEAAQEPEAGEC